MHLSIIVPAYNEEKNLCRNITAFNNYLKQQSYGYEILIVNDGSTDNTILAAEKLKEELSNIRIISNSQNRGKGAVVRQGLQSTQGDYRLFIDADNATSIDHINKIWEHFHNGYDIVIGSRNPRDAHGAYQAIKQPPWKRFLGICGNRIIQLLVVKNIWDTQCGFKAFSRQAVTELIPKTTINRWLLDVEILAIAQRSNYKIAKIPVFWRNHPVSRTRLISYLSALGELLKIKYNLLTNKYK